MRSTGGGLTGVTATHSLVLDLKPDRDVLVRVRPVHRADPGVVAERQTPARAPASNKR